MNILLLSVLVSACLADRPAPSHPGYSHFQPASHFDIRAQSVNRHVSRSGFSAPRPASQPAFSNSRRVPQQSSLSFAPRSAPRPSSFSSAPRPAPRPSSFSSAPRPAPRPTFFSAAQRPSSFSSVPRPAARPSFSSVPRPAPQPSSFSSVPRPAPRPTFSSVPRPAALQPTYYASRKVVPILVDERVHPEDGSYSFSVETADGVRRQESGQAVYGQEGPVSAISGSYSFTLPDGQLFTMSYVADENGFQPVSPFLPVAPAFPHPIPAHALQQIEKARLEDEAYARKHHHQGYGA